MEKQSLRNRKVVLKRNQIKQRLEYRGHALVSLLSVRGLFSLLVNIRVKVGRSNVKFRSKCCLTLNNERVFDIDRVLFAMTYL